MSLGHREDITLEIVFHPLLNPLPSKGEVIACPRLTGACRGRSPRQCHQTPNPKSQESAGILPCRGSGGVPQVLSSIPQDWGPGGWFSGL